MRVMRFLIAIATMMAVVGAAWANDTDVEKLLENMRNAYQKPQTARIKTEAILLEKQDSKMSMQFELTFKRPYKIFCKVSKFPGQEGKDIFWVTDGKTIKSVTSDGTRRDSITPDELGRGWPLNLESLCFWDSNRQLSTKAGANMELSKFNVIEKETWNDKEWLVLEETANGQDVFVRYFIDPKTFYIWRCVVWDIDKKKQRYDVVVRELEIDPVVDDKIFDINRDIGG